MQSDMDHYDLCGADYHIPMATYCYRDSMRETEVELVRRKDKSEQQ
jgi:hypothetical protein